MSLATPLRPRHFDKFLNGNVVIITAVAAYYIGFAFYAADGIENGLNEVFKIVGLHHDFGFFAQAAGTHFLVGVGGSSNCFYHTLSF